MNRLTLGGLALVVILATAAALPFFLGPGDEAACTPSCEQEPLQPTATSADEDPTRQTTVEHTFLMPADATVLGTVLVVDSWRAFTSQPDNLTGVLVEGVYQAPTEGTGLSPLNVSVGPSGNVLNATSEPNDAGIHVLHVTGEEWVNGNLWVNIMPSGDASVIVGARIDVYVTAFTHGPPDWSFSAVAT